MRERGQALTLEGSIAAVLLITSLIFALQVSAVTPLTESTSSQHIENQQKEVGQDVLAVAAEDGTLKSTVLYWDQEAERHRGAHPDEEGYTGGIPSSGDELAEDDSEAEYPDVIELGELLERTFSDRGIAYNIHLNYLEEDEGDIEHQSQPLVNQGEPSNHAVTVTRTITLYDSDTLYSDGAQLGDSDTEFFADNIDEDSRLYNVIEIELVIWRM